MKTIYIKFNDPVYFDKQFIKQEDITKQSSSEVEVVGFLVKETDDLLFIATRVVGEEFINILDVPKENITERLEGHKEINKDKHRDVRVETYKDMRIVRGKFTLKDLKDIKPLEVNAVGFMAGETDKDLYLATERSKNRYRTLNVIPKGLIL